MENSKILKRGLFVGRFQPLHNGHINSIKYCLDKVEELIVVIGSSDKSFESKNPFTAGERIEIIREAICSEINKETLQKIFIIPVPDIGIHRLWTYNMEILVPKYNIVFTNDQFTSLLFRERGIQIDHPELINREILSATEVRSRIINNKNWKELVSITTVNIIEEIKGIERIKTINKINTDHH
ncbi:MAG TPA: nicotinamide-nucleotide adenylyltransferase [Verrucomicrobiae bacterium]|nr:nicotinamide-nucleotide adenylyltransferase [Verrucomicrobiae bacterium]